MAGAGEHDAWVDVNKFLAGDDLSPKQASVVGEERSEEAELPQQAPLPHPPIPPVVPPAAQRPAPTARPYRPPTPLTVAQRDRLRRVQDLSNAIAQMAIMGNVTRLTADQCEALGQLGSSLYLELLNLAETTRAPPAAAGIRPAQQPPAVPMVPTLAAPRMVTLPAHMPVVTPLVYRPAYAPETPLTIPVVPQMSAVPRPRPRPHTWLPMGDLGQPPKRPRKRNACSHPKNETCEVCTPSAQTGVEEKPRPASRN